MEAPGEPGAFWNNIININTNNIKYDVSDSKQGVSPLPLNSVKLLLTKY